MRTVLKKPFIVQIQVQSTRLSGPLGLSGQWIKLFRVLLTFENPEKVCLSGPLGLKPVIALKLVSAHGICIPARAVPLGSANKEYPQANDPCTNSTTTGYDGFTHWLKRLKTL
jgi:hypothetical protein